MTFGTRHVEKVLHNLKPVERNADASYEHQTPIIPSQKKSRYNITSKDNLANKFEQSNASHSILDKVDQAKYSSNQSNQ